MNFNTIYFDPPDRELEETDYLVMSVVFEEEDWEELSVPRDALEYDSLYLGNDEFYNIRDKWKDPFYLRDFYREHLTYFQTPYWKGISEERFVSDVAASRANIFQDFHNACKNHSLYDHFEPYSKVDAAIREENSKRKRHKFVRLKSKYGFIINKTAFRLYAIEIDYNCFIITGGVIKTVEEMHQAPSTSLESQKMDYVLDSLITAKINSKKDLISL